MLQKFQLCVTLLLILTIKCGYGANIMYLCALPSPSHQIWLEFGVNFFIQLQNWFWLKIIHRNHALANGLAARGHNVTIISPDVFENVTKEIHHIHLEGLYSTDWTKWAKSLFTYTSELNPLREPINFDNEWAALCKGV